MISLIKILLQFGSFKIHIMKIQLSSIIFRKISENSVHFSQFTQKHHKYRQILHKNFLNFQTFLIVYHFYF